MWTAKCPGRSDSSLGTQSFCWFCHEAAHNDPTLLDRQVWEKGVDLDQTRAVISRSILIVIISVFLDVLLKG